MPIKYLTLWFVIALFVCKAALANSSEGPLFLNHADEMTGWNKQGVYQLRGNVLMTYDSMTISTGLAIWRKDISKIEAENKINFQFPNRSLQGLRGDFEKTKNIARLQNECVYRDTLNTLVLRGDSMVYFRELEKVDISGRAELEIQTIDSLDQKDTLFISAKIFRYMRKENKIYAWGGVKLRGVGVLAVGDSGWIDRSANLAYLLGSPNASFSNQWLFADQMKIDFKEGKLGSLWATGTARGFQLPETKKSVKSIKDTVGWLSQIRGDTLVMWVENKEPKVLQTWVDAQSEYREQKFLNNINTLVGDSLKLVLNNKVPDSAFAMDNARSTYYYTDKEKVMGKNELRGDLLVMVFKKGRVESVKVSGELASGRYLPLGDSNDEIEKTVKYDTAAQLLEQQNTNPSDSILIKNSKDQTDELTKNKGVNINAKKVNQSFLEKKFDNIGKMNKLDKAESKVKDSSD